MSSVTSGSTALEVERLPNLERVRDRWQPLADACGNPFLTWEWASTWWRHFGADREQLILGCSCGNGDLIGIAPLHVHSHRPLRVLRPIGHFPADELGIVCAPEHEAATGEALGDHLTTAEPWDMLLVDRAPDATLAEQLDAQILRTDALPELRIETSDWDEFLASKSSNFRGQVRNYERRLRRDHGLELRLCDNPERLEQDMETLVRLHHLTRASRGENPVGAFPPELVAFHLDFARVALERGWLRFWLAYLDGEPAAAWYGFRLGGADWFYQSGRDPRWQRESVGFVLMAHTLRDAVESGIGTYKLLLGTEEYKRRFSNRAPTIDSFAATRGVSGRAALGAKLVGTRLRQRVNRLRGR